MKTDDFLYFLKYTISTLQAIIYCKSEIKSSSFSVEFCSPSSLFARRVRALLMAALVRLVKMAIWVGGIEIFIR